MREIYRERSRKFATLETLYIIIFQFEYRVLYYTSHKDYRIFFGSILYVIKNLSPELLNVV